MRRDKYTRPKFRKDVKLKRFTVPDQTLSLQEIVRRYTRGIAIDIQHNDPIYVDQNEHDLEKMTRMDVYDKAAIAQQIRDKAQKTISDLKEMKAEEEAAAAAAQRVTHRNASDDDDEGEGGRQHGERDDSRKASRPKARETGKA